MEVLKNRLPGSVLDVNVRLEAGEVDSVFDQVYQEISDQGGIPGFRPGHVPPVIIRRRVDDEQLQQMAWMRLVEEHYPQILEEHDIDPLDDPEFPDPEKVNLEEGEALEFDFTVPVKPEPEIEQYKGIEIIKPAVEVTDEDIDEAIQQMREAEAEEVKPDRDAVAEGDIVTGDLRIQLEGADEPLSEGEQEFQIGSGLYNPPIDEDLKGRMVGQTVEIEHEYPEDFEDEDLAGETATISVKIKELREQQLPELDDEFAQSQGYEDLEELRQNVHEQVQNRMEEEAREEAENSALANILAGTTIDLPEQLVDQMAEQNFENFQSQLDQEGLDMESFSEIAGVSEQEVRENERTRAEASLKLDFVLSEIREREDIELEDEDLDAEIERFAESSGSDPDFVRQALDVQDGLEEQLRERALRNKVVDFILDKAEIEEIPPDEWEEVKEAERERLEQQTEAEDEQVGAAEETEKESEQDEAAAVIDPGEETELTEQGALETETDQNLVEETDEPDEVVDADED